MFKQMHSRIGADVLGDQGEQRKTIEYGGKRMVSSSSDIKDVSKNCSVMFLGQLRALFTTSAHRYTSLQCIKYWKIRSSGWHSISRVEGIHHI